jgi:hypothetical protein
MAGFAGLRDGKGLRFRVVGRSSSDAALAEPLRKQDSVRASPLRLPENGTADLDARYA